jgi:energy-coupling factor transport system ATP-binding protein
MTSTRPMAPEQQPRGPTSRSNSRALTPVEMAQAAVMGALSAALAIVSIVVPFAGGLSLLVAVPMGLLGYRYRLRVLLAAAFAAATITFLIAGISGFMVVLNCAYVGGLTGIIKRRRRGALTVIAVAIVAGVLNGLWIIAVLTILERLRTLTFEALTANVEGMLTALSKFEVFRDSVAETRAIFHVALRNWPALIMSYSIFTMMIVSVVGWWALSRVLERLRGIPDVHKLETPEDTGPVAPVPVRLRQARFRYPGADHDALRPLDLTVDAGEHVAITGANGSEDHVDAAVVRPAADLGQRRAPRRGGPGRTGRHRRRHAASGEPGAGHPGRRRRRVGSAARNPDRRRRPARRSGSDRDGGARHRRPVRRGTAAPRGRRGAGPPTLDADRRRDHHHG